MLRLVLNPVNTTDGDCRQRTIILSYPQITGLEGLDHGTMEHCAPPSISSSTGQSNQLSDKKNEEKSSAYIS